MNNQKYIGKNIDYTDELVDFIGREKELGLLSDAASFINKKEHLVFVKGEGGVGKTVLVKKFKQKNQKTDIASKVIPIDYDFDDNAFHSAENLRLSIALKLSKLTNLSFDDYLTQHKGVEEARKSGSRSGSNFIRLLHQKATKRWLSILEKSEKKFIFYFDTIDKLSNIQIDRIGRYFFSKVPKNSLIVISGRNTQIKLLKNIIKQQNIELYNQATTLDLRPLTEEEYDKFIIKKITYYGYSAVDDLPVEEPKVFIQFIKKASNGLPILIGLSLEQFSSPETKKINAFMEGISNLKHKNLTNEKLQEEFKKLLIHYYLENFSSQLRLLVIVLAHAWPLGKRAIEVVLNLDEKNSQKLMEEARKAIYIKRISNNLASTNANIAKSPYFLSLHDVMREMINKFAWPEYDKNANIRREVSTKYIEILDRVINEGEKKHEKIISNNTSSKTLDSNDQLLLYSLQALMQRLRIQKVRHTTCLNIKEGLELFSNTLKKGSTEDNETQSQYIDELSHHIEDIIKTFHGKDIYQLFSDANNENLKPTLVNYFVEKLNFLASRGRLLEANRLVHKIESIKQYLVFEFRIGLFLEIAITYLKNGKLQEGLKLLNQLSKDCIDKNNKSAFIKLFPVYIQLGWAYRLLGNIKKADECYSEADLLLLEHDLLPGIDIDISDVASLYQTWAYTKALLGESREAKQFITVARSKFKEIKFDLGEGYIESVSGRIQIEFDDYNDAIRCFEKAKDIFPEDNEEWQSKVLLGLAEAHILRSEYEKNNLSDTEIQNDINLACDYLENVRKWNYPSERPETLFLFGVLHLHKKDYQKADEFYKEAWKESESQGSLYYLYRSLLGRMRLNQLNILNDNNESYKKAEDFIRIHTAMVHAHSGITEDLLANAIYGKIIGNLYFLEGNHKKALEYYKKNLPIIAKKGRFYAISLKGQLDRMEDMFLSYATDESGIINKNREKEVHKLAQNLWSFWKAKSYTREYPSANPVIRSWISGRINEWNHAPTNNKNKKEELGDK